MTGPGFLAEPEPTAEVRRSFAEDVAELGYVMNGTRLWAHQPGTQADLFALMGRALRPAGADARRRAVLVAACASAFGDSYCALAWGARLADATDAEVAAAVLRGDDRGLSPVERALAGWARAVARDPGGTTAADVRALRDAGLTDPEVFAVTVFVALRLALATVNDALGALPDAELAAGVPPAVRDAVAFGRPVAGTRSPAAG